MKPINELSLQEIYDISTRGVLAQGCASAAGGRCLYRGPNGTKCAAGFLMTDEQAAHGDGQHLQPTFGCQPCASGLDRERVELISSLQSAHDGATVYEPGFFVKRFARTAKDIALDFRLTPNAEVLKALND